VSSHICRQCQLIFRHLPPLSSGAGTVRVKHHANKTTLEQSATTCGLCDLFILAFNLIEPNYEYEFYGKPGVVYIGVSPAIEGRSWRVRWCYPSDEDSRYGTRGCSIVIDPTRGVGKLPLLFVFWVIIFRSIGRDFRRLNVYERWITCSQRLAGCMSIT
jgi:hypothetical protein